MDATEDQVVGCVPGKEVVHKACIAGLEIEIGGPCRAAVAPHRLQHGDEPLKPEVIDLFVQFLNNYAYLNLGIEDAEFFDNLYNNADKEYCDILVQNI